MKAALQQAELSEKLQVEQNTAAQADHAGRSRTSDASR